MSDRINGEASTDSISSISVQEEMKSCYLDYAMSVIIGRALPDVRDGLKPVHRRSLFAMHSLGNFHNRPFLKSARIVGDIIGKYHPHGDAAVYQTIVRLVQDFSMRYPLINGQGNFGSIDGDAPAAMRYTEVRMKKIAEEMLHDLDKDTVDWQPNYDDSLKEPRVMPTKIPNLLVNGSAGIAVGMSTNIPPHNMQEVIGALKTLLKEPKSKIADLMKFIKGPDFPTGGIICGTEGIRSAYHTGRGIIQVRAKADIEVFGKSASRERIVITEIPYQVNKARMIEKIAELVNSKQIRGISDIRDESNRHGIRVVIELKKGEFGSVILNRLYKQTAMQTSFGITFLAIFNGRPQVMNIKEQLAAFIDHRREVVIRRTIFDLKRAKERAHILEGLKTAVENIDAIVEMIKSASNPADAKEKLVVTYSISNIQAQAVLDMKLQRLTGLERDKIVADHQEVIKEIARLQKIIDNENLIRGIIEKEFDEIAKSHGDERRTEIVQTNDEILIEDLVKREDVIVTITHNGYVKRMAMDTYKTQKRGGTGVKGASVDNDFFTDIFTAHTHSTLFFFTNRGTVFAKKVYEIPEGTRTAQGRNIVNLIQVPRGEKVKKILCVDNLENTEDRCIIFATERGIVKKSFLKEYRRIKQSGLRAIKVVDGDNLIAVGLAEPGKDVLMCSTSGKIIRFAESSFRPLGRVSQGVKGIDINDKEKIIGMEIIDDSVDILSVTENGYGKRTKTSQYRRQSRGGKGVLAMKLTEKNGEICAIKPVCDENDLMIITNKGQVIRTKISGISLMGRTTQGVRIIRLKGSEKVVAVEKIAKESG